MQVSADLGCNQPINNVTDQLQFRNVRSSRYLDQIAQHTEEKLDKHRFLVQSRVIDDHDYNRINSLPASQRSEEVSLVWYLSCGSASLTPIACSSTVREALGGSEGRPKEPEVESGVHFTGQPQC